VYDVIGDIHGHAVALRSLLTELGYVPRGASMRYPGKRRTAIFVGDYIDRGPGIPETVELVRAMCDAGDAIACIGNHEYNALLYHTRATAGGYLRSHTNAHLSQHRETLAQCRVDTQAGSQWFDNALAWFATLPLWYETETLRVVHAVWDDRAIAAIQAQAPFTDDAFLRRSAERRTIEHHAVETLLKGVEVDLPDGASYTDKDGMVRSATRVRWWVDPRSFGEDDIPLRDIAMPPADRGIGDSSIPRRALTGIPGYRDDRPVFVGHYWLTGTPHPLAPRVACLDYSVAADGFLCAYRYEGEPELTPDGFVCVDARGQRVHA
jgi:hypothetical protein